MSELRPTYRGLRTRYRHREVVVGGWLAVWASALWTSISYMYVHASQYRTSASSVTLHMHIGNDHQCLLITTDEIDSTVFLSFFFLPGPRLDA